jgi:hypothetical protein
MTKREIRKAGHLAIVKDGNSHQDAFDAIQAKGKVERNLLAEELSKIPSTGKLKSTLILRGIFIGALSLIIVARVISLVTIGLEGQFNMGLLIGLVALGILVPVIGIYGALFAQPHLYYSTGMLVGLSIFRSLTNGEMVVSSEMIVILIPFFVAVVLAFFIPSKLKTPYKKSTSEHIIDGKSVKRMEYVFEDTRLNPTDLLDNHL